MYSTLYTQMHLHGNGSRNRNKNRNTVQDGQVVRKVEISRLGRVRSGQIRSDRIRYHWPAIPSGVVPMAGAVAPHCRPGSTEDLHRGPKGEGLRRQQ